MELWRWQKTKMDLSNMVLLYLAVILLVLLAFIIKGPIPFSFDKVDPKTQQTAPPNYPTE